MKIDKTISQQMATTSGQVKKQVSEENKGPSDSVTLGGRTDDLNIMAPPMKDVKYALTSLDSVTETVDDVPNSGKFTFMFDTGGHYNIRDIQLKASLNPETGQFDPKWNLGKGIPMNDDQIAGDKKSGDGIYSVTKDLNVADPNKQFQWYVTGDVYDGAWFQVTDDTVKDLKNKFDDSNKLNILKALKDTKPSKDELIVDLKNANFSEQEIKMVLEHTLPGNKVSSGKSLMTENGVRTFEVDGPFTKQIERLTTHHLMGVHKKGEDGISFWTWAPAVGKDDLKDYKLYVDVVDKNGKMTSSTPMMKDPITGNWNLEKDTGWKELEGMAYRYSVRDKDGTILKNANKTPVAYSDPYSRYLQGQQRGVERIYVDPVLGIETGWYDDSGKGGCNYADNPQWGRFAVSNRPDASKAQLVLMDENGKQLTKKELIDRLGEPKLINYNDAKPGDKRDVDTLNSWKVDTSGKVTKYQWIDGVRDDGTIDMKKTGDSWVSTVNNFDKLKGMRYELRVYDKDGKLEGDKDGDGKLSEAERRDTPFNDPVSNIIADRPGAERLSLIKESSYKFKYANARRKTDDPRKYVIYEAHVGSFMGPKDNAAPSTFKTMIDNLDYIENLAKFKITDKVLDKLETLKINTKDLKDLLGKDMTKDEITDALKKKGYTGDQIKEILLDSGRGINTIELMPTNEFGGKHDWGYTPDYYFAGAEAYGFDMPVKEALERGLITPEEAAGKNSVWIHGTDAIKLFVDEAHNRGFNVFADVVYNHVSGKADADNPLAMIDGDKKSFFKWWGQYVSQSPWGEKPAYEEKEVKQFFSNNATQQLDELGYDGIRFDFVQVLHDTGSTGEKWEGTQTLRKINKTIDNVNPNAVTDAENFTHEWLVAADYDKSEWSGQGEWAVEKQGMGFDGVWSDKFHHTLVRAIGGSENMDSLMGALTGHVGVSDASHAVIYAHSHDEVGNSGDWVPRDAAHSRDDKEVQKPYPRAMARFAALITLTSPGNPMIFQGEEFADNADYKHGITSTWGNDLKWLNVNMDPRQLAVIKSAAENPSQAANLSSEEKEYLNRYVQMTPDQKADAEVLANKRGIHNWYRELAALRADSDALYPTSTMNKLYTHNDNGILAYERKGEKDDYIIIGNRNNRSYSNYKIGLPPGQWKEVMNSDSILFGGDNFGNGGSIINGDSPLNIPMGGIVLKRVG